ncbi:MAG: hypothetical protein RLZZ532_3959 [Cyanobacteriota bacterium]
MILTLEPTPHLVLHTEGGNRYLPLMGKNYWTFGRSEDNTFKVYNIKLELFYLINYETCHRHQNSLPSSPGF